MAEEATTHAEPISGNGRRHNGDRRIHQRRARSRLSGDRRRFRDRRKKQLGGLLLAAATFAVPHAARKPVSWSKSHSASSTRSPAKPNVSVTIDEFKAGKPEDLYEPLIQEAANMYGVPAGLIRAVMQTESAFNPFAVSRVGAKGLMQLMPPLAKEMGVTDPFDPRQNVMAGAKYLRKLLDLHSGNIRLALASYNAGPANVKRYKGIPPFKETRNYVEKITDIIADDAADTHD